MTRTMRPRTKPESKGPRHPAGKGGAARSLPDLQSLRTVRQLCEEYPQLFTEGSLRWIIFRRKTNGFDRCVLHVGRRLFIDLEELRQWLGAHRGSRIEGPQVLAHE